MKSNILKQALNFILIFTFVFVWGCVSVQNFLASRPVVVQKESVIKQNGSSTLPRVWSA